MAKAKQGTEKTEEKKTTGKSGKAGTGTGKAADKKTTEKAASAAKGKQATAAQTKAKAESKGKQSSGKKVQTHADKLRVEIPELLATADSNYLAAAERLSEVWHKGYYTTPFGYEKFDHYCEAELPWKPRAAKYLIEVFDKANLLNLPKKRITKIGWTKMKDLVAILEKEMSEEDIEAWLSFAETHKALEVTEEVKKHRRRTRTSTASSEATGQITWRLRMTESEANILTDGINEAKALCNTTNDVTALEMIVQDWMEFKGNRPSRATVEDAIAHMEKAYGVIIEGYRNQGEALNEDSKNDKSSAETFEDSGELESDTSETPDDEDIDAILGLDD